MLSEKSTKLAPVITKIQYQFCENISSIKNVSINNMVVNFNEDYIWEDIYFTPATAKYKEPKKHTDNTGGYLFEQELSFKVPGDLSASSDELNKLDVFPVIIKIEYNNGIKKIIGSLSKPAIFKTSSQNIFSFMCKTTHRAYLLEE